MDDPHSREKELRNYIGMVCCIASMTIIGVFWGRDLPVWAPAALGAAFGYTCWLAQRAYHSLRGRKGKPSSR